MDEPHGKLPAELLKLDIHGPDKVKSGRTLVLTCTLVEGGDVRFSWFKDGRVLTAGARTALTSTSETSVLTIKHIASEDGGEYSCLAQDGLSEERKVKRVRIEGIPNFPQLLA